MPALVIAIRFDAGLLRQALPAAGKNLRQLLWRNNFELGVSAVAGIFIGAPSSKLGGMTEASALHMLIGNFHYQFGPQRLPR